MFGDGERYVVKEGVGEDGRAYNGDGIVDARGGCGVWYTYIYCLHWEVEKGAEVRWNGCGCGATEWG